MKENANNVLQTDLSTEGEPSETVNELLKFSYFEKQRSLNLGHKAAIGKWVVEFLVDEFPETGPTIFLDSGSTVEVVSKDLLKAMEKGKLISTTVVTNSMPVFNQLYPKMPALGLRLIHTGGEYDPFHQAFWGLRTVDVMKSHDYDVVCLGASAVSFGTGKGPYIHGLTNEEISKSAFFRKDTDYRMILVDYSKIGAVDVRACVEPDEFLEGVRRECLIVTTKPPVNEKNPDDAHIRRRFYRELEAFKRLCMRINAEELNIDPVLTENLDDLEFTPTKALKLVIIDTEKGTTQELSSSSYYRAQDSRNSVVSAPTAESTAGMVANSEK
jgi:DeoR/GlpR family transcriptional regulator of sugar metabolism